MRFQAEIGFADQSFNSLERYENEIVAALLSSRKNRV